MTELPIINCDIFIIGDADCSVMKKISNWLITEADTDYRKFLVCSICLTCILLVDLSTTIKSINSFDVKILFHLNVILRFQETYSPRHWRIED